MGVKNAGDRFYSISEMCMEKIFQEITSGLSYLYCTYIKISHKNSDLPFRQRKLSQKAVLTWNYKFLQT